MFNIKNNEYGSIEVSREVVETLAGLAAVDCYGLVGMVAQDLQSGLSSILGIDSVRKGVTVKGSDRGLIIDVFVVVVYGVKILEVSHSVMQKVAYMLEDKAGLPVAAVNVNVKGVKVLG